MKTFRVTFRLKSAVASAWQADTIFGHLCWALRYLDGEEALKGFIDSYRNGSPPLIISDGFPGDFLPNPILTLHQGLAGTPLKKQIEEFDRAKESRKVGLLTRDEFNTAINCEPVQPAGPKPMPKTRVALKNQINRLTNTTGEGGHLFESEETFWRDIPISIYLKVKDGFEDHAEKLFRFVAEQGYGKRKSVGYGEIASMDFEPFTGFESPSNANGFITLSHFVPSKNDPHEGFWKTLVKYGKLGEEYAIGENPFKKPIIMFTAGSVFRDSKPREFYGRLVDDISSVPGVAQYAFAFPVPMKLPEWRDKS